MVVKIESSHTLDSDDVFLNEYKKLLEREKNEREHESEVKPINGGRKIVKESENFTLSAKNCPER